MNSGWLLKAFFGSFFTLIIFKIIAVILKRLYNRRMEKYLGWEWQTYPDPKLQEHDQKLADLLHELNMAREAQRGEISDDARVLASKNFQACMEKVSQWRKERDMAYSLAFRAGHGEVAEARIKVGLPTATQARDRRVGMT